MRMSCIANLKTEAHDLMIMRERLPLVSPKAVNLFATCPPLIACSCMKEMPCA